LPHRSGVGGYPAAARHPPDEWQEPGGLLQAYKPGPNVCSNPALHRSSHLTKPLRCQPQQRQHRRLATLDLAVESCEEHHPASPPPRRAPPPSAHRPPGDAPHEKPEEQQWRSWFGPLACPFPRDSRGTTNKGGQNLTDHTPALLPAHAALRSASLHGGVGHSAVSLACHKRESATVNGGHS
jgi:hypothetical protein